MFDTVGDRFLFRINIDKLRESMKDIAGYIREYITNYFHARFYLLTAIFLAVCIFLNYYFNIDENFFDQFERTLLDWPVMSALEAFPFLVTCLFLYLLSLNKQWLRSKDFWVRFAIGFGILGFSRGFYYHQLLFDGWEAADSYFLKRSLYWASSLVHTVFPLIVVSLLMEKGEDRNFYGLIRKKFNWKPYAILLLIAAFFIAIGSFLGEIQSYYPRYTKSGGAAFATNNGIGEWISVLIYELAYGSNFISVEMVFRGYLVMAFSRILGGYVVVAMVTSYCFLHFGKPLGETISSVFGGYILGIISLYTRNIWGGIWIHVGVAWLMELFAYLQNQY